MKALHGILSSRFCLGKASWGHPTGLGAEIGDPVNSQSRAVVADSESYIIYTISPAVSTERQAFVWGTVPVPRLPLRKLGGETVGFYVATYIPM